MRKQKKQNILAYAVSPVNADPDLDVYAAAEEMKDAGVTPLYMTMESARAKLMLAFSRYGDQNSGDIDEFMTDNYVGEIPEKQSRRQVIA